jgi:hypothetical protein
MPPRVVIGDRPLTEYLPLQQKGAEAEVVTQFPMGDVEALGLLKMDFLGLRNLDVIDRAVELVEQTTGQRLSMHDLPLDDARTYEMLTRGDATGVFQFESGGMREALRQVRPTRFEDLIALGALYRPGPMQNIPKFAARKNGREPVTYPDPRLEGILSETSGITVYQEQSMLIAREIAGFSPRRSRRLAQGDRQEDPLADDLAEGQVHRRLPGQRHLSPGCRAALGRQRAQQRLLVQQGARSLLRAHLVPHGLAEGQPSRRVHGRPDLVGDVDQGPGALLRVGVRVDGHRGASARRQLQPG